MIKRSNLALIFALVLALSAAFLLSCGGSQGGGPQAAAGVKQVNFWTIQLKPTFTDYIEGMIADYEAEHPGVKIVWNDFPHQVLQQQILNALSANTPIDVVNLNMSSFQLYAQEDALLDLDDYMTAEEIGKYIPNIWEQNKYEGKSFGIPWYISTSLLMYNRQIMEQAGLDPAKPPKTIYEMADMAKTIQQKTGKFGFMDTIAENGIFMSRLATEGIPVIDMKTREPLFDNPQAAEYLQFWADLYKNGIVPKETILEEHRKSIEMYSSGQIAMFNSGPQFLVQIKKNSPDIYEHTMIAPGMVGPPGKYSIAIMNLVIFNRSKHPKEAVEFAQFVTNGKNQLDFCKQVVIFPSVKEAADDPFFTSGGDVEAEARKVSIEQLPDAANLNPGFEGREVMNELIDTAVQEACLGHKTAAEALHDASEQWKTHLKNE